MINLYTLLHVIHLNRANSRKKNKARVFGLEKNSVFAPHLTLFKPVLMQSCRQQMTRPTEPPEEFYDKEVITSGENLFLLGKLTIAAKKSSAN